MTHNEISMKRIHQGFTLAEITIVVSILVILSLAILRSLDPIKQFFKGYDSVRKSDLAKLKSAFENYYSDHDCYPSQSILSQCGSAALTPYMDKIPCDPSGDPYKVYLLPEDSSCPQRFSVYANLSFSSDKQGDDIVFCPQTIAAYSTDMNYLDVIKGCSNQSLCKTMYGCINGACVVVAEDSIPSCSPSSCDPTCGVDCSKKNRKGQYANACR